MAQSEDRPLEPLIQTARMLKVWLTRGLGLGVLVGLIALYLVKLWRRFAPLFSSQGLSRLAYRAELDRLAEISQRRGFGETRERFADRMATLSPSFVLLTQQHLAAKFARQGEVDADQVRQVSRAVAREVRGRVSWWRRWLGVLSPWSWLLSR